MKEEEKPKEEKDILNIPFSELNEKEQTKFFELAKKNVYEKYSKVVPPEVLSNSHTIVLENGLGCIIKIPNASITGKVLNKLSAFSGEPDVTGAGKVILDNCWICGDREIQETASFALAAGIQCVSTVDVIQGSIKKN